MAKERRGSARLKEMPFGKTNLYILGIGLLLLVIGFILMAQPPVNGFLSLTLSPIILMIAYLVIIPYAILHGRPTDSKDKTPGQPS